MKANPQRTTLLSLQNKVLYKGKYDMKTINSLVLDFEMIVEEEEFSEKKVKIIRIFVNFFNSICYLLNIVMKTKNLKQSNTGRIKFLN